MACSLRSISDLAHSPYQQKEIRLTRIPLVDDAHVHNDLYPPTFSYAILDLSLLVA